MKKIHQYALGLLAEECGEVCKASGKALRFGLDTPHTEGGKPVQGIPLCRDALAVECGDVLAAIAYAVESGMIDLESVMEQADHKLHKLKNPNSRDSLGRRLAPELPKP